MNVFLNGISTAVPPHELPQDLVLDFARRILGPRYAQFERMAKTFQTSGVEKRYSLAPVEWFEEPQNWPERNALYLSGSKTLFIEAARKALGQAGLAASEIDTVVTVSSTGIATPTIDALAWKDMGFRSNVQRIPVFGLGCAGGVSGMSIGAAQARAKPGSNVLVVAVEACTLSFRSDRLQKADIIATVLFGDGAAAACLSTQPNEMASTTVAFGEGQEQIWPDTLDIMGWDVDEVGLGVVFDRSIPAFAEEHLSTATQNALERSKINMDDVDRFVCHPGGTKVVEAIESTLELPCESLGIERSILRDYGNMSAPTVMFVLDRLLDQKVAEKTEEQMMMCALGPGFTASFLPFTVTY